MKLSIRICGTKDYLHVWRALLRRIVVATSHRHDVHIVYVSSDHDDCRKAFDLLCEMVPRRWQTEHRVAGEEPKPSDGAKYKEKIQQLIARMHGMGFEAARAVEAEQCWTIEPDVLPPPDALRVMEWALAMPQVDGSPYYDIVFCTYPNGHFIGGFGTYQNHIHHDFLAEERTLAADLQKRYAKMKREEAQFQKSKKQPDKAWVDSAKALNEEIMKCPPKGNIWQANAQQWRRRGWLDHAYPAIGRGAIVPVDWCGEGCNLLSKKALSLAFYDGYTGQGTQDLFLCWNRYNPNGLRTACITHTVCDHVKHQNGKLVHYRAYHEPDGEMKGHLRVAQQEWVDLT